MYYIWDRFREKGPNACDFKFFDILEVCNVRIGVSVMEL